MQSIHAEQHQKGEESILGKEWAENARDRHVSRWIAKAIFAQESMGCVSPYAIVDWAKEKGLSNLLPKDYSIFRKFNNCKKCGEQMRAGKYINQTYSGLPDFAGGEVVTMSPGGTGSLENCLKCVNCGWSTA